ncbi:hypothetical protein GGR52DRAFT_60335 [Hypoxylon sp. FL1284]|nr:hypothetical protein GGR52DRAFT_60335 [Hypoxylon sp. FL1284]
MGSRQDRHANQTGQIETQIGTPELGCCSLIFCICLRRSRTETGRIRAPISHTTTASLGGQVSLQCAYATLGSTGSPNLKGLSSSASSIIVRRSNELRRRRLAGGAGSIPITVGLLLPGEVVMKEGLTDDQDIWQYAGVIRSFTAVSYLREVRTELEYFDPRPEILPWALGTLHAWTMVHASPRCCRSDGRLGFGVSCDTLWLTVPPSTALFFC